VKILLVSNYQPPHMGGIEFAAGSLKRCWEEDGHEVTWMTTDIPRGAQPSTEDNIRIPAANFFEKWFQINCPIVSPFALRKIANAVKTHDVVNIHSLAPSLASLCLLMAIHWNRPVVATQHVGIIRLRWRLMDHVQRKVYRWLTRWSITHDVPVTFVGEAVRSWFSTITGIPKEQFSMTPAGIDQHSYYFVPDEERQTLRKKWNLDNNALNVLFVGRFYEKKGLPLLKAVAEQCPNIRFTLVGGGPIDAAAWSLPNVRVLHFVKTEDLRELYGCHDLFIMPSFGEGWPAVVPQAMASGLPCLISEETYEGFNRDSEQFLVRKRDVDIITQTLNDAAAGKINLLKDRKALSDYAMNTWDWKKTARIYLDLFREVIQRGNEPLRRAQYFPLKSKIAGFLFHEIQRALFTFFKDAAYILTDHTKANEVYAAQNQQQGNL